MPLGAIWKFCRFSFIHDDVIKWKHFPRYWPFARGIPTQRQVTRSFDVFFDLRPNKRLSKQSWGWWFETPSIPLWCHFNVQQVMDAVGDSEVIWFSAWASQCVDTHQSYERPFHITGHMCGEFTRGPFYQYCVLGMDKSSHPKPSIGYNYTSMHIL